MEAGDRRKAREHIECLAGFLPDSKQKKHFVKNPLHLIVTYKGSSKTTYEVMSYVQRQLPYPPATIRIPVPLNQIKPLSFVCLWKAGTLT
jgi:hypothetical protein